MLILAAVLTASINLDLTTLIKRTQQPAVTCGIVTVGYRFRGTPGQTFRYAGDSYEIPEEGWVELIADRRRTTYTVKGRSISLEGSPRDPFGFRDVSLPTPVPSLASNKQTGSSQQGGSK